MSAWIKLKQIRGLTQVHERSEQDQETAEGVSARLVPGNLPERLPSEPADPRDQQNESLGGQQKARPVEQAVEDLVL